MTAAPMISDHGERFGAGSGKGMTTSGAGSKGLPGDGAVSGVDGSGDFAGTGASSAGLSVWYHRPFMAANPKTVAEPSGAVAVAGFLFRGDKLPRTTINVAVISGGNIDPAMLEEIRSR